MICFGSERVKAEYKKHHMITALSHYAYVDTEMYHMSDSWKNEKNSRFNDSGKSQ